MKLKMAITYYEKKNWYRASVLLDDIVPLLKGREEVEKAQYYQAYTYYNDKQYIMGSYYFKEFVETYPRSPFTEECTFLQAKSAYKNSPEYNLDQTPTLEAVAAMQSFVNTYPTSTYLPEANQITDELNKKLELKAYENANLFYKIGNFKSAVVTFTEFMEKYPDSEYIEQVAFNKINAQFNLALLSVEGQKKKDRYYDTVEFYHNFIDKFPNSKYKKAAESIFDVCVKQISKFNS